MSNNILLKKQSGGGAGAAELEDLTDVDLTSPAAGDILYYTGTIWANLAAPTSTSSSYYLTFNDTTNSLVWSEDTIPAATTWSDVLSAGNTSGSSNAVMSTNTQLRWRDSATYMNSPASNELRVVAPTYLMTISTAWSVLANSLNFNVGGFMKNDSSGNITGGNIIDISSDTNLAVTSPIVLTGDTVSLDFSTNNTWTGTNSFQEGISVPEGEKVSLNNSGTTYIWLNPSTGKVEIYVNNVKKGAFG